MRVLRHAPVLPGGDDAADYTGGPAAAAAAAPTAAPHRAESAASEFTIASLPWHRITTIVVAGRFLKIEVADYPSRSEAATHLFKALRSPSAEGMLHRLLQAWYHAQDGRAVSWDPFAKVRPPLPVAVQQAASEPPAEAPLQPAVEASMQAAIVSPLVRPADNVAGSGGGGLELGQPAPAAASAAARELSASRSPPGGGVFRERIPVKCGLLQNGRERYGRAVLCIEDDVSFLQHTPCSVF